MEWGPRNSFPSWSVSFGEGSQDKKIMDEVDVTAAVYSIHPLSPLISISAHVRVHYHVYTTAQAPTELSCVPKCCTTLL